MWPVGGQSERNATALDAMWSSSWTTLRPGIDPLGSRSPGCCYHSWNPQLYLPCRVCQRPVLTLQQCTVRHPPPYVRPSYPEPEQREECPRRQRSSETPSPRRHAEIIDRRPPSNPYYHTHPPPSSSSGHYLSKSVSAARLGSPGGSLGQRSPGARAQKPPALETPDRWIGEETKRSLPSHVYKYYLAHTKEYRRQNKVTGAVVLAIGPGLMTTFDTGVLILWVGQV